MQWLSENSFYLNLLFALVSFCALLMLIRPLLLWYFGCYKTHREITTLKTQIDDQARSIEALKQIIDGQQTDAQNTTDTLENSPPLIADETLKQLSFEEAETVSPAPTKTTNKARQKQEPWLDLN